MRLHVREWGAADAPVVVCLHGIARTSELFAPLATETLGDFRVLALDLRGHGASPWEPPWRIDTNADDVLQTLGFVRPHAFVGHSFGGRLVIELAARRPDLVERAVLLDPAIRLRPDIALRLADEELVRREPAYSHSAAIAMHGELAGDHARVEALQVPTLLVVPGTEAVVGPRQLEHARRVCSKLTVRMVGGTHHVLEDAFAETAPLIRDFLQG
jgi:alpha-beta hydrolase superfamily lysophospholipase